jgi:hypothetical protein
MNKAAGYLAFAPFPVNEDRFLLDLAKIDWGKNATIVVQAWKYFQESYTNFPINLSFTWYGPLHNSIVWPLYLYPIDKPISPSWKYAFPQDSGDRIGECICYAHTLDEVLVLLHRMAEQWNQGVELLKGIEGDYSNQREQRLEIGLCIAIGLQMNSAYNVFKFYSLREKLPFLSRRQQLATLTKIKQLVKAEIHNSQQLEVLCLEDSRLGFHSEAENYKYYPTKLAWRKTLLEKLLAEDFPVIKSEIDAGGKLFAEYTGEKTSGKVYQCRPGKAVEGTWEALADGNTIWQGWYDNENMYFEFKCKYLANHPQEQDFIELEIEPCRLWPVKIFRLTFAGKKYTYDYMFDSNESWNSKVHKEVNGWRAEFTIPFACFEGFHKKDRPLRINITRNDYSWVKKHPWESRLRFVDYNPADLGWLVFRKSTSHCETSSNVEKSEELVCN